MKELNTDGLEYGDVDTLSYANIVEVAIRHGFPDDLREQFEEYVEEAIENHIAYRNWEIRMGDDL